SIYFSIHYNKFNKEMKFNVEIDVMPLKALLDPQGKAVTSSMQNIGLGVISNVRIGKHITLEIEAANEKEAEEKVEKACKELLHNPIMESYTFVIKQA
ncbi:MAG: phosphoribosylformylglycinamidine synthase subunit PurS, partial [Bacteroidales bacterium]|nr:phosphoribosylformylglycinamidine synthase subunit PurS [Bacteroidales bacterium]